MCREEDVSQKNTDFIKKLNFHTLFPLYMNRLILLFLLQITLPVCAQRLSEQEVRKRVMDFLALSDKIKGDNMARSRGTIELDKAYTAENEYICVYDIPHKGGFVIATTDRRTPAVVGYSDSGAFADAKSNPSFNLLLKSYEKCMPKYNPPILYDAGIPEVVTPLLHDTWHQYSPFWNMTPVVNSKQCLTGCVAHAMAEVMKYYEYPKCGNGSHTYTDVRGCGETLTANFKEHVYDWHNILDSYTLGNYTQEQADAVARLISDCGIAVNMRYSPIASGAFPIYQPIALTEYFGYDRGLQIYFRDFFSYAEWDRMLKKELAEGRPILISGYSATEAHAFVCDGYDRNGLYHINWGWEGEANGYYDMQIMSPDLPDWFDRNNPEQGLNLTQIVCVGIRPASESMSPERHSFAFSAIKPLDANIARNEAFSVVTSNMSNIGWNIHDGKVCIALKGDGTIDILKDYEHNFLLEEIEDTTYTDTLTISIPTHIQDGTYRIVPVFQDNGEWKEARTTIGVPNYILAHVSSDSIMLHEDMENMACLSITGLDFPDTLIQASPPEYSITLHNEGSEFFGRIYFALENPDNPGIYTVFSQQGMTLEAGEISTRTFNRTPFTLAKGKYVLRIFHDLNLFNDSIVMIKNLPEKNVTVVNQAEVSIKNIKKESEKAEVVIYSLDGRILHHTHTSNMEDAISKTNLTRGVYIVSQGRRKMKIVK